MQAFYTTIKDRGFGCLEWWKSQPVELYVVTPEVVGCAVEDFNRLRRVYADHMATGLHIVADDDAIPQCDIQEAFNLAGKYPDFGTLSLWPEPCIIHQWTEIQAFEDEHVMEHASVGVIRIQQKGLPYPPSNGIGYDRTHGDAIREVGKKVGLLKNFHCYHYGENKSSLWLNPPC